MQLFLATRAPAAEIHARKERSSFLRMSKIIRPIVGAGGVWRFVYPGQGSRI